MKRATLILLLIASTAHTDPARDLLLAEQTCKWIYTSFKYVRSASENKTAMRTLADREGDCYDLSVLMVAMLAEDGVRANVWIMDLPELGDRHVVVELYGYLYDPTKGVMYHDGLPMKYRVNYIVSYSMLLLEWGLRDHIKAAAQGR